VCGFLGPRFRGDERIPAVIAHSVSLRSTRYLLFVSEGHAMLKTVAAFHRIGGENAFAVLARANALAAHGRDISNLGIGQPDFRTPDFIVEAAVKALRDGHHGYTPAVGIPPLREAVAADLGKRFKVEVSPDEVMILPGGKPTMFMSILMFGER